jgi:hypothetical protein
MLGSKSISGRRLGRVRSYQRHRRQPDLIRVAVARDPHKAVPISGTWTRFLSDDLDMMVEVEVTARRREEGAENRRENAPPTRRGVTHPCRAEIGFPLKTGKHAFQPLKKRLSGLKTYR